MQTDEQGGALPMWAPQVLLELERSQQALLHLREQQIQDMENVSRSVECALLGAQREEQRLIDRVGQEHRDTRLQLEQLQKENTAAAQAIQASIEERLQSLAQLRDQIQRGGRTNLEKNLQHRISELLLWEPPFSLKRVSFHPPPHQLVLFGEIRVQEHSLRLRTPHEGQSRGQGDSCHSKGVNRNQIQACGGENRVQRVNGAVVKTADEKVIEWSPKTSVAECGGVRVVRKIRLSPRVAETEVPALDLSSLADSRIHSQKPELEVDDGERDLAMSLDSERDLFQAVPAFLSDGESENGEEETVIEKGTEGNHIKSSPHSSRALVLLSSRCPSARQEGALEGSKQSLEDEQDPKTGIRDSAISRSCLDLSPRYRSPSHVSLSLEDPAVGAYGDTGRPASPADSIDSSYTFIVSSPRDYTIPIRSSGVDLRLSKSTFDLSRRGPPLIEGSGRDEVGQRRVNRKCLSSASSSLRRLSNGNETKDLCSTGFKISMSVIDVSSAPSKRGSAGLKLRAFHSAREQQQGSGMGGKGDKVEQTVIKEEGREGQKQGRLVRQFGKFGSGRAELSLPSGLHAMPQGQLYVVDCGNARVQVTDARGNILQQVSTQGTEGSTARRHHNYFDIAVNGKGLIALSCAAERALLIFNRHGRRLQAFGGGGDELEAPRGVAVNQRDEFVVADTRRGTLTAFQLEPKTGRKLERTVVPGFCKPYLVAASLTTGLVAVSERGSETSGAPCVKVLDPSWSTIRILGINAGLGPVLSCPWGVCIDTDGDILVADWAKEHKVLLYPSQGTGRSIITEGLSSPRGLALLPDGHLVVADSMHNCIKIFQYK
ncbi:TRIM3 protein, partial [Atractosteus spatula]|nr:TRIM3 protein [Atractosteus spatula]